MKQTTTSLIGRVLSVTTIGYLILRYLMFPLFELWDNIVMGLNHLIW